jgi:CRISPR-associated protein Cmr2
MSEPEFWKRKLAAFLHDPPCKPLNLSKVHEDEARQMLKAALPGFDEDKLLALIKTVKSADWTASAADRFCFPSGSAPSKFTGQVGSTFRHPLGGAEYEIPKLPELGQALEWLQNAFGGIRVDESAPEAEQLRQRFFLYWRRFMEQTVLQPGGARDLAFYPADTRIPDHTIWNHMNLASALEACRINGEIRPAFLIVQLGPVQDFIAAARSTRDLWSGSYLLALLTANAIKAVTDQLGADNIIFPALRGQGVFDILHQNEVYSKIFYKAGEDQEHSLWERMYGHDEKACRRLLNPTLPNRFVALVPENQAEALGEAAAKAISDSLHEISKACFKQFVSLAKQANATEALIKDMEKRWYKQVDLFPQISWAATPWQHDVDQAIADFANFPINTSKEKTWTPHKIMSEYRQVAQKISTYRDNSGFLWMLNYHRAEFALAARRNTRDFEQFVTDENQNATPKDALTGKEEIIGNEDLWNNLSPLKNSPFKKNEGPYGAVSIIKRLWWRTETGFLGSKLQVPANVLKRAMDLDSVADVAARNEGGQGAQTDADGERMPKNPYVAIIALDGDQMGKWVSGDKAPKLLDQVSQIARTYLESINIDVDLPRALSPSYHMQFSEALSNFATYLAGPVVEHHQGQLIYAGGDDVLAMVPADQALNCARTLRAAFRGMAGELPEEQRSYDLASTQNGFVLADNAYPLVVPGPAAEVSVGIAIGHYKHPLQAMVREAQNAEHRAKSTEHYDRAAFAVSLVKRGGETIHWGAKWNSGALKLYDAYCELRKGENPPVAARFPYALAALLKPYKLQNMKCETGFDAAAIIKTELETVFDRQGGKELSELCDAYLANLTTTGRYEDFVNLFLTATFIKRERGQ